MTVITMPDGQSVDFGNMPPDQIKALVQKRYPDWKPAEKATLPWYGEEKGIAAKLLDAGKNIVTGIDDVMSGRVDAGSDRGVANITDAALVATPPAAASRSVGWMGAAKGRNVATPAGNELIGAGDFGFRLSREMGVDYSARAVQNTMLKTRSQLFTDGVIEELAPKSFAILKRLEHPPEGGVATIAGLHAARRQLAKASQDFNNPTEQEASVAIIKAIDDFITNPDPKAVVAGDAATAASIWRDAMDNYAAGSRSDRLVDKPFSLEERSNRRLNPLSSTSSDKSIRDRVGALLDDPKRRSGLSAEEITLLESVKDGSAARNLVSFVGNLMGPGPIAASTLTGAGTGLFFGGPIGAAVGAAPGALIGAAKVAGGALTRRSLNKAAEKVRQRSPLFEDRVATAPAPPALASPGTRSAMGRVVMGGRAVKSNDAAFDILEKNQITPQQYEEYLRRKYGRGFLGDAPDQGA